MALTKAQRARLDKLATYLEGLPKNYRHFDMSDFFHAEDVEGENALELNYGLHNGGLPSCGAVACALGHGPAAGVLVPKKMTYAGGVKWSLYGALFIGDDTRADSWLFCGSWTSVDNHHHGAAARIRYLLDKGEPPANFYSFGGRRHRDLYAPYRIDAKAPAA
jgi:hypothetical protein